MIVSALRITLNQGDVVNPYSSINSCNIYCMVSGFENPGYLTQF